MTFQHLWTVMLQYSWLVMAVASHGTAQHRIRTKPRKMSSHMRTPRTTSPRPYKDPHNTLGRTKLAASTPSKKSPKSNARRVWPYALLAITTGLGIYIAIGQSSTRFPNPIASSTYQDSDQDESTHTSHVVTPISTPSPDPPMFSMFDGSDQHTTTHTSHLVKPIPTPSPDPPTFSMFGDNNQYTTTYTYHPTSTLSTHQGQGQNIPAYTFPKSLQKPNDPNPFDALVFGAQEKAWHASLGPLPDNVKIEDYELNPAFLKASILPEIAVGDVKKYPKNFDTSSKQLFELFKDANFPDDAMFPSPYKDHDIHYKGSSCDKNTVLTILQPATFKKEMEKKDFWGDRTKTFNYIIDKMHALDIGKGNQANKDLSKQQQKNLDNVRKLLKDIPTVYKECYAITDGFNANAAMVLGLNTAKPVHFPAKIYVYLKTTLRTYLDMAASAFILREYVKRERCTDKEAQEAFSDSIFRQHAIAGLQYICKDYITLPNTTLPMELLRSYQGFLGLPKDELFPTEEKEAKQKAEQEALAQTFLAFFRTTYAKDVFKELKAITLNAYYGDVPLNSYVEFAQEKGLDRDALFVDDTYQALAPDPFLRTLVNIKLLTPKST